MLCNTREIFITILLLLLILYSSFADAKDITQNVRIHTDLDEKIAKGCSSGCGNRGYSELRLVQVTKINQSRSDVIVKAKLKYHQHTNTIIGGGFGIEKTMWVTARGHINPRTCVLQVNSVSVSGDIFGSVGKAAKKEEGKTHNLRNCHLYLN